MHGRILFDDKVLPVETLVTAFGAGFVFIQLLLRDGGTAIAVDLPFGAIAHIVVTVGEHIGKARPVLKTCIRIYINGILRARLTAFGSNDNYTVRPA